MLRVTLPAWRAFLPKDAAIVVVTTPADLESQDVAHEAGVRCHVTDAFTAGGAAFNKARALDEGFSLTGSGPKPSGQELCLAVDADIYPCGRWPTTPFASGVLYSCSRYHCLTPADLHAHLSGRTRRDELELVSAKARANGYDPIANTQENARKMAGRCLGYFQLFRWRPGVHFGDSPTAAQYDLAFRTQFRRRIGLLNPYLLHLGEQRTANWRGRVVSSWQEECA
jgi:hypothetical protein